MVARTDLRSGWRGLGRSRRVSGDSLVATDSVSGAIDDVSLVLDAAGRPVVSYRAGYSLNPPQDLRVLHCGEANCVTFAVAAPDTAGNVGEFSSIALDADGYPVVSYYDHTNRDLKVLHCGDSNCAGNSNTITAPDTAGDVGMYSRVALDTAGNPVISYIDNNNVALKVLHCGDHNCTTGTLSPSPTMWGRLGHTRR